MNTLIPPETAIDLSKFWTWMGSDGVCRTKAKPGANINLEEAIGNSRAVSSFFSGKKYPLLVDARDVASISKEARNQFAINGRETCITCFGLIVKSPLSRVIGNFFIGLNRPSVPARLFDDEQDALNWLHEYF